MEVNGFTSTVLSTDSKDGLGSSGNSVHFGKTTLLSAYETDVSYNPNNNSNDPGITLEVDSLISSNEKVTGFKIDVENDKVEYQLGKHLYFKFINFLY